MNRLSAFSSNSASELDVLRHDGHALGVNRAQVGVLEKTHQISLGRLLQRSNGCRLEPQIGLEVLRDFSHKTLERELADEQLSRLLVPSDFSQSDGSRPVTMRFLDPSGGWRALPGSFGGQLLPRSLTSGRFTGRLLGTSHSLLKSVAFG